MEESIKNQNSVFKSKLWIVSFSFLIIGFLFLFTLLGAYLIPFPYDAIFRYLYLLSHVFLLASFVLAIIDKVKHKEHPKVLVVLSAILFTLSWLYYVVFILYTLIVLHALAESGFLG